jgi:uncharacterized protein (DUF1800 family)
MPSHFRPSVAFLLAVAACSGARSGVSSSTGRAPTPIIVVTPTEPREQTADQQVQQVLNRLAFGPRPGDVAHVRAIGVDQWIALQLAPDRIPDDSAEAVIASYEMLHRPTPDLVQMYDEGQRLIREMQRRQAQTGDTTARRDMRAELLRENPALRDQLRRNQRILGDVQSARLARAVASERQLQEVMTDFWENHFTVFAGKGVTRLFVGSYDQDVIRPLALGRFRDLLGAVAKSPAMLFYLDQWQSAADSLHPTLANARAPARGRGALAVRPPPQRRRGLNENYARELLELHTLGVDGGYTQHDIIEVARALSGWTMNPRQGAEFVFRPEIHDAGEKMVLGHRIASGHGIEDGETVLDILARDPHTAHFIARKLAIRFVGDDPPTSVVDRAAATFARTDGDIREVVRTIVTSPEFFSRAAYRAKVKTPFELVASALRAVGASPDTSLRTAQTVAFLGQPIFGHQAPNGWPETGEAWMNTGAILNRINFGLALAAGRLPTASVARWAEEERLRSAPRDEQVDSVVSAFLGGNVSPDTREILLRGENPLVAKLGADNATAAAAAPGMPLTPAGPGMPLGMPPGMQAFARPVQLQGIAQIVGLAIGAPEFQRR